MITKVKISNFRIFREFSLELNSDTNIIVGDNESGKSTILEAIQLALTRRTNGRAVDNEISSFLFNRDCVGEYLTALGKGENPALPSIVIEVYFGDNPELQHLRGSNNSEKADCLGVKLEISFDEDFSEEYGKLLEKRNEILTIPAEYYRVHWYSFANNAITRPPLGVSTIDATTIRLQSGTDYYLQNLISSSLDPKERVGLSIAYRKLKEKFSQEEAIQNINHGLTQKKGAITQKGLAIAIDVSQRSNWESSLIPHLDEVPFQLIGKGEQSALKIMLALERRASEAHLILIEEPENHLSFSSMSMLISKIQEKCPGKQIIIVTHSAYVLNKLGVEKVTFLSGGRTTSLRTLPADTRDYFRKLSGYDTLRLILSKKAILVEGPSDELVVQKAYLNKYQKLPIEDRIDVINIRGLSFERFLDISKQLGKPTAVVTDNDGDYQRKVGEKYQPYDGETWLKICADDDNGAQTLEPQIAKVNSLEGLNKVLGTTYRAKSDLVDWMQKNKTECALRIFDTQEPITFPQYIQDAIS